MKKIFITGASGCIGHYVIDQFIDNTDFELHLLLREPKRLKFSYQDNARIKLHLGNLEHIEEFEAVIRDMNYVIHIATDWSDSDYAWLLNVEKTHKMFGYCDREKCEKIVYFSTASIMGPGNRIIEEAGKYGSGYVRSKYLAYEALSQSPMADRIVTLFPTLVFGGDATHPYSHISAGISKNTRFLKLLRFIYMDSAFHFLHAEDIAKVAAYALLHKTDRPFYVLGNAELSGKKAIEILCRHFSIPIYFRIKIGAWFIFMLAKMFRIAIDPWTKYCIENPFFAYNVVNPETFGETCSYPTLQSVLRKIVIQ